MEPGAPVITDDHQALIEKLRRHLARVHSLFMGTMQMLEPVHRASGQVRLRGHQNSGQLLL
ncbi:hypothetical protein BJF83_21330 [Nocardiopsis sp. CNR-923]|nr:hypothetical protein BJF83_21330 [Nocardiopsis sp. CNR-923]